MTTAPRHLLSETPDSLAPWLEAHDQPAYRATQILEWVYRHGAASIDAMSNLPRTLREAMTGEFVIYSSEIIRRAESRDGTIKLLLRWPDAATSECVLIPDGDRRTACIGSQVGCPVGCRFCASGLDGVERNLTAGQIIEQVQRVRQLCEFASADAPDGGSRAVRLSNIVFMGSGEPLANYANVLAAIRTLNAPWGPSIGARKITLSTVGLPKQIRALAEEGLQLNLALSLHAPTSELRRELIPWAEQIRLPDLIAACRHYFDRTGREITLEYILLDRVNDRPEHATELAQVAKSMRCNVNLIRYNPIDGLPYERPTSEATHAFQAILRKAGVNAHVRTSRGLDIDAACGQLRRKARDESSVPVELRAPSSKNA